MQAIRTRYCAPTVELSSRIAASCDSGRLVVKMEPELSREENHSRAAKLLTEKLGWWIEDAKDGHRTQDGRVAYGELVTGSLPDSSFVHVFAVPSSVFATTITGAGVACDRESDEGFDMDREQ